MNFAQDIQASIDSANFVKLVRPLCVLTQGSSFITDDDIIFQGLNQFNTIGLVLSAAKDKDNTRLFKLPTTYQAVLSLMIDSEYSSGLLNVAAELTAANIIRSLPLNADLKLIDRGKELETRAYANLDRIIFLYTSSQTVSSTTQTKISTTDYFFFAPALDKSTIPANSFDVGLETEPVKLTDVLAQTSLSVPDNQIAFIYFNVLKSEPGAPPLLNEGVTVVNSGETVESLIFRLSSDINDLCANVYTIGAAEYPYSNLIATPTRTTNSDISLSVKKKELYPATTTFKNKTANFTTELYSVYLEFSARRLSTIVATEAIVIRPITILRASLLPLYKGAYDNNSSYMVNEVIESTGTLYRSLINNNTAPLTNTNSWQVVPLSSIAYTKLDLVNKKNNYLYDYINGLVLGKFSTNYLNYSALQDKGPLSSIIDVTKGVSKSTTATATSASSKLDHKIEIDTFYFAYADTANPYCTVGGTMYFRISTISTAVPWVPIAVSVGDKVEDIAFKLVQGILEYRVAEDTHVVGAQIYNNAVYINAYKVTNPEVKVIVDLKFEDIQGITVASYYHLQAPALTQYNTSPRSVAVTTVLRINVATNNTDTTIKKGVSSAELGSKANTKLSSVKDKMSMLRDLTGVQSVWSRSNLY
jgi:hypothetical protein